jgi:hypothetical protein
MDDISKAVVKYYRGASSEMHHLGLRASRLVLRFAVGSPEQRIMVELANAVAAAQLALHQRKLAHYKELRNADKPA